MQRSHCFATCATSPADLDEGSLIPGVGLLALRRPGLPTLVLAPKCRLFEIEDPIAPSDLELRTLGIEPLRPRLAECPMDARALASREGLSPRAGRPAVIIAPKGNEVAMRLAQQLNRLSIGRWKVEQSIPAEHLPTLRICFDPPWSDPNPSSICHRETSDGLCIGPGPASLLGARVALGLTERERQLKALGFERSLSTLPMWAERDPEGLARWIALLETLPGNACVLPESGRIVDVPHAVGLAPAVYSHVDRMVWAHGAIADLAVRQAVSAPPVFVSSASIHPPSFDGLDQVFGKGYTREQAWWSAVGECVERISASNWYPPNDSVDALPHFQLCDFHPFGEEWSRAAEVPLRNASFVRACDLSNARDVAVPAALIPFPLFPDGSGFRPTRSDTCGLAAYPTYEGAVVRGALEILERDDLYPNLMVMRIGYRVPVDGRAREVAEGSRLSVTAITFALEQPIAIVHAFVSDPERRAMARGSGSGRTLTAATEGAVAEAIQVLEFNNEALERGSKDPTLNVWASSQLKHLLNDYFSEFPLIEVAETRHGDTSDLDTLALILGAVRGRNQPLIACNLPSPLASWSAVRVLIPGATCHQHASRSAGGSRLSPRVFPFPILT